MESDGGEKITNVCLGMIAAGLLALCLGGSFALVWSSVYRDCPKSSGDWQDQAIKRGFGHYETRHSGKITITEFKWNGE